MIINNILFPVDFSEQCANAAPTVQEMAARFSAQVTLFHAWMPAAVTYDPWGLALPAIPNTEALNETLKCSLAAFGEKYLSGIHQPTIATAVQQGEPGLAIADYARENRIDLIMMPTHGYGVFRRALLGSVTAKVLHDSDCPVWTSVHCDVHDHVQTPVKTILCALDPKGDAGSEIRAAGCLAQEFGARLYFVSSLNPLGDPRVEEQIWPERKLKAAEDVMELLKREGTTGQVRVESGDVAHVVRQTAIELHADLVVIARGHSSKAFGAIRSHAFSIIRESPCPVWSV
jgi:nucleotide-binding universal stress UspA family protein